MDSKDFRTLNDAYRFIYEAKEESPEKEEEDRKKDDDLAGSPNKKKNGKKADKDYDGDGKVESSKDEYFGSKDKAIKKAMGKDVKESRWWDVDISEAMVVTNADKKANTPAYQNYKKGLKKKDGTPMYKAADHMKEGYGKKKKKHDCASKVKHEEYGVGNCIKEMHDLDENGNVAHYDVLFDHGVEKHVPVESLQILEGHMHDHVIRDYDHLIREKESYDTVAAVIDYDRSKKGSKDATYDSMHGEKKKAKKERDYAAWEREKMKKDDPNWKHKKYHTGMHGEEVDRLGKFEDYDELDNDLLEFAENTLCNFPEDEILDMMESMYHRRNPGKKHPLESGSSKVTPRPVSDKEKKSTDKEDRMYVAMRRVKDRQKGYSKAKSDAADKLHGHYTSRQSARKKGASPKEAAAGSHGDFGSKGFRIKRGGRSGEAPRTDRGTGNKAARRAGQEVKDRDPRKK